MIVQVGENDVSCAVGLLWESYKNKSNKAKSSPYAICDMNGAPSQVGVSEDNSIIGSPSLAACCAKLFYDAIVVSKVKSKIEDGEYLYWMCAVSQGVIMPETDKLFSDIYKMYEAIDSIKEIFEDIPAIKQFCDGDFYIDGQNISMHVLDVNDFEASHYVKMHGISPMMEKIIAGGLLAVMIVGGGGYYLYDKNQKEKIAQQQIEEQQALLAQQIIDRDIKLTTQSVSSAIAAIKSMRSIPEFIKGWSLKSISWSNGKPFDALYNRLDGTADMMKSYITKNYKSAQVVFNPSKDILIHVMYKTSNINIINHDDMSRFKDVVDKVSSSFQELGSSFNMIYTPKYQGGSSTLSAISWSIQSSDPEFALKRINIYGLIVTSVTYSYQTSKWNVKGEIYALP